MKATLALITAALVLAAAPAFAQERSAGQAYDAQVNWGVLRNKLDALNTQNQAIAASLTALQASVNDINSKLKASAACGAQKKFWTGSGCVAGSSDSKIETGSFTYDMGFERVARKYTTAPPTNSFCQSKGFDVLSSMTPVMADYHTGGREGSEGSYINYYTVVCMRVR